jgi:hypothetical protein
MTITVDIADRQYDYTDEEKAAEAVAAFQLEAGLTDQAVVDLWAIEKDPRRFELQRRIFEAVDRNGSAKRAQDSVPAGVSLLLDTDG